MRLKRGSLVIALMLVAGCQTSSYKLLHDNSRRAGIEATGDRIIIICEPNPDPDDPSTADDRYGFMVFAVDDKKELVSIVQFNFVDKRTCHDRMAAFERMKKRSKKFYVGGYTPGFHKRMPEKIRKTYVPGFGWVPDSPYSISFSILKSQDNECITKVFGDGKPCPEIEGFPEADAFR